MGSEPKVNFDPQPVTLTGNLVRLEPMELGHAADLYAVGAEDSIWRYAARPALRSVVDAEGGSRRVWRNRQRAHGLRLRLFSWRRARRWVRLHT